MTFVPASFGRLGYHGPRPIHGHGVHHYGFSVYALSSPVERAAGVKELLAAAGRAGARARQDHRNRSAMRSTPVPG